MTDSYALYPCASWGRRTKRHTAPWPFNACTYHHYTSIQKATLRARMTALPQIVNELEQVQEMGEEWYESKPRMISTKWKFNFDRWTRNGIHGMAASDLDTAEFQQEDVVDVGIPPGRIVLTAEGMSQGSDHLHHGSTG